VGLPGVGGAAMGGEEVQQQQQQEAGMEGRLRTSQLRRIIVTRHSSLHLDRVIGLMPSHFGLFHSKNCKHSSATFKNHFKLNQ
jgi:hypothetical protein